MKHYTIIPILISIFCLGWPTLQAQGPATTLTVSSDYHAFWLFLDDVQLNEQPVKSIKVDRIPEGKHYLRVEIDNREHHTFGQYVLLAHANNHYKIENQRNLYGISQNFGMVRPEMVAVFSTKPQNPPRPQGHHNPGNAFHPGAPVPMNNADFQAALTYIQSKNFDKDKLSAAKQVLVNNFVTVNQIDQICRLFSFDKDKLEFAKHAYSRCVDQNRYFMLGTVFSFESSKTELEQFVQQQH